MNHSLWCHGLLWVALGSALLSGPHGPPSDPGSPYIVQGSNLEATRAEVEAVGGQITHELAIISAVGARLRPPQMQLLRSAGLRLQRDRAVKSSARPELAPTLPSDQLFGLFTPDSYYPTQVGAHRLHRRGIRGRGITVAVVDTGLSPVSGIRYAADGRFRLLAHYDARSDDAFEPDESYQTTDRNGHGTHVSSIIASGRRTWYGSYNGVAPDADLVAVKVLDREGQGTYLDVIRGLNWVLDNRERYGIRVVNLSLSAPPRSYYWEDPLNQAVMKLWEAGVVVVASAGNSGPEPGTIRVPGNVPYVITVGALSDRYTPFYPGDDVLTSFSAAGPTAEAFVKPDLVAPGGHMLGLMGISAKLARRHPTYLLLANYFVMSGTSQAAAVVSGVAALILEQAPQLSPDEVKCWLMAEARPARRSRSDDDDDDDGSGADGELAYSVFQQGAGKVWANIELTGEATCANRGLDVQLDLAGVEHYGGLARLDSDGGFFVAGLEQDGLRWDGSFVGGDGYNWEDEPPGDGGGGDGAGTDDLPWTVGGSWMGDQVGDGDFAEGYSWSGDLSETMATNRWVDQE